MKNNSCQVKRINTSDPSLDIASIHQAVLKGSFLASVDQNLLTLIYKSIPLSKEGILIIAMHREEVVGFICGTNSLRKLLVLMSKNYPLKLIFSIMLTCKSFANIKKMIELAKYSLLHSKDIALHKPDIKMPDYELLSMCVLTGFQGLGVGKMLYMKFMQEVMKENIPAFKIVVGKRLVGAQQFYSSMGAMEVGHISLHGKSGSNRCRPYSPKRGRSQIGTPILGSFWPKSDHLIHTEACNRQIE